MAITPNADKTAFFNRISNDPWIARNLGITDSNGNKYDKDVAVQKILKRREVTDQLTDTSMYVLIFDPPSTDVRGPWSRSVMQVDVLVPSNWQNRADTMLEQIVALCGPNRGNADGWCVNGKSVETVISVGDLAAAHGFYRAGVRFYYYSSHITKKRTI